MRKTLSIVLIACLILALGLAAGCSKKTEQAAPDKGAPEKQATEKLVVGAIGEPHTAMLKMVKSKLAEQGVEMEIKDFTEYSQLNPALNDKQIDANFFQHIPYLEDFNAKTNSKLVWTVKIHTEPMRIYSEKIDKLDKLADGAIVGIPNDPTNSGRALAVLQSAGLIKLKEGAGVTATERDIIENPKKIGDKNGRCCHPAPGTAGCSYLLHQYQLCPGCRAGSHESCFCGTRRFTLCQCSGSKTRR